MPFSKEHKLKLSLKKKGRFLTKEHKLKIALSTKGKPKSEEHTRKNSESHKGLKHSDATKRKRKEARKLFDTEEYRTKISESMKKVWENRKKDNLGVKHQDVRLGTLPNLPLGSLDSGHIFN